MLDFEYPLHLLLFGAPLVVLVLFIWARLSRRAKLRRFGRQDIIDKLMPDASRYKARIKIVLELIAMGALVIVLARPHYGEKKTEISRSNGIEAVIAFDVSNSMLASASDDPNGLSRLNRARLLLEKLIDRLDNDKVGLIVFAGEAKTQLPLTTDFYTAKMYLKDLSPDMVTYQGTSITDAINLSADAFSDTKDVGKAIILITDAEDHEGDAVEAARQAAANGIQVDVIGVGTAAAVPIPLNGNRSELMRDDTGAVVRTAFDEASARQIAEAGKGVYVNGSSASALDTLVKSLDNLDKADLGNVKYKASAEQFPTFAWIALIMLVIDVFVLDRKIGWLKKINFFSKDDKK